MLVSISIQEIVSINPSFLLSHYNEEKCECCFEHRSSSNTLNTSSVQKRNEESKVHQLKLIRDNARTRVWLVVEEKHCSAFDLHINNGEEVIFIFKLLYYGETESISEVCGSIPPVSSLDNDTTRWIDLRSNGQELMARLRLYISPHKRHKDELPNLQSFSEPAIRPPIYEQRLFHLTISLNEISKYDVQNSKESFWILYEFVGAVVKSCEYKSSISFFEPKEDEFQLSIHSHDIYEFFTENKINMHVCNKDGKVLGETEIDLYSTLIKNIDTSLRGCSNSIQKWITMNHIDNASIDGDSHQGSVFHNEESDKKKTSINVRVGLKVVVSEIGVTNGRAELDSNEQREFMKRYPNSDDIESNTSNENLIGKVNKIARAELEFDKRKQKWEDFRIKEERKFQDYLRKKERDLQHQVEDEMKRKGSESFNTINMCRSEYKRLESRLKSALTQVEAKERDMDRILAANNTSFVQKVTELDLKEKLIQEEAKHTIEMERVKKEAIVERIKGCEMVADESKRRAMTAEAEVEQLRTKFKSSNEAKLSQEIQMLRDRMEDMKLQLARERKEKDQISLQRDEYRQAAYKLAKIIRKQRGKKESNCGNSKICRKEIQELHRIQNELSTLSVKEQE